jgi:hypothetical protein
MQESTQKIWGRYTFEFIRAICPEIDGTGTTREFMPQAQYENRKGLQLSSHGHGPFCKFRISNKKRYAGVYVLTVGGQPVYVGECVNLSDRYNSGYGNISPRNCYEGGQRTNCRINNLIYTTSKTGQQIGLWFLRTTDRKAIESELIDILQPAWNRKGITTR